jgi:hypothetical protein
MLALIINALFWGWPIMRVVDYFRKEIAWPSSDEEKR